jgi:polysaccharide biosynthesis/export protein
MRHTVLLAGCATLLLGGCMGQTALHSTKDLRVVDAQTLPPPTRADTTSESQVYAIGPFDELDITVFNLREAGQKVRVDAGGNIALPLAGTLHAAGRSPQELSAEIEAALRRNYVRNPQVAVNVTDIVSQTATVDGEVKKPGNYPVIGTTSLLRIVAQAEGTTQYAKLSQVVVFRTVNGERLAALYDMRAIRNGLYADPDVYARDVVVVGDSPARRLFTDIIGASALVTTPLIILLTR